MTSKTTKGSRGDATSAGDATPKQDAQKELVRKRQADRRKQYDRNRRNWMLTKVIGGVLALAIVALLGFWGFDQIRSSDDDEAGTIPAGVTSYNYAGGQHDDNFNSWTESPPVGGFHNNVWQNCAYYDTSVPSGRAVHSLEHGAIWITYRVDLPQDQKDTLKQLTKGDQFMLISEYDNQDSPIVVTAWNKQLKVQTADDKEIKQFIKAFENTPKNTPEYGARCSGGSSATG